MWTAQRGVGYELKTCKGASESTDVMSADLSGPQPEAFGAHYAYMLVAVFKPLSAPPNLPRANGVTTTIVETHCVSKFDINQKP